MENENMRSIFSFRLKLPGSCNLFIFYSFIALLLTIKFSSNIYPIKFRWAVEKGAKYKVVSYVYEKKLGEDKKTEQKLFICKEKISHCPMSAIIIK